MGGRGLETCHIFNRTSPQYFSTTSAIWFLKRTWPTYWDKNGQPVKKKKTVYTVYGI